MKLQRLAFFCFIGLVSMSATCERPLEINITEQEPDLVVISNFEANKDITVQIFQTRSVLSLEAAPFIYDAVVRLYEGETFISNLSLEEDTGGKPKYTTNNFQPLLNTTYSIMVEAGGFESVMAKSRIPGVTDIKRAKLANLVIERTLEAIVNYSFTVTLDFEDPQNENNYYHLNFLHKPFLEEAQEKDTAIQEQPLQKIPFTNIDDNNFIIAGEVGGVLFEDTPFNGNFVSYSFPINYSIESPETMLGDLIIELRSVSADYYKYQRSLTQQQNNPGAPFSEPVVLYNNIKNGQGIFAGYSVAIDTIEVRR